MSKVNELRNTATSPGNPSRWTITGQMPDELCSGGARI
jgi:hypothetical protein